MTLIFLYMCKYVHILGYINGKSLPNGDANEDGMLLMHVTNHGFFFCHLLYELTSEYINQ